MSKPIVPISVEPNPHGGSTNKQLVSEQSLPTPAWWAKTIEGVRDELLTDLVHGMSGELVRQRRERFGWNELTEEPPTPFWKKVLRQFSELVILILIVASVISGLIGEWVDAAAILAIVAVNGAISLIQEEKSGRALAALRKLSSPTVKVVRDGSLQTLPARDIVPGDRLELEAGDNVPADARLLQAYSFRIQEAALTGESVPASKQAECVLSETTSLGDRRNMAYMGTVVATGKASAVVVSTGMATELGQIAGLLEHSKIETTPLQRRLTALGKILIVACLAIVAVVFVLHLLRGAAVLEVLLISISLAVAAVPEGLPAVVTLTLAVGLQRMSKRNALVRKLPSVETLGSVTVICSDKTGTLTRNEMTVREVIAGGIHYQVTGIGYTPTGQFVRAGTPDNVNSSSSRTGAHDEPVQAQDEPDLIQVLTIAARCNNAKVTAIGDNGTAWRVIGDPTEGALLVAAQGENRC